MYGFIVTGGSKGLGEAMVQELLSMEAIVVCLSRTKSAAWENGIGEQLGRLKWISCDLSLPETVEGALSEGLAELRQETLQSVTLINNAGTLDPMAPIGKTSGNDLTRNIHLNLLAPMLLTSAFIRFTEGLAVKKRVIHISSGAGKKPYPGWGSYCTSKAGLDMFTQCVGAEQGTDDPFAVKVLSIAPGVIDTSMQQAIRETSEENFPQVGRFIQLKEQGQLQTAAATAQRILSLWREDAWAQGAVLDIRNL